MQNHHQEIYRNAARAHMTQSAIQWGCGLAALAVLGGIVWSEYRPGAKLEDVTPIALTGLGVSALAVITAEVHRPGYEAARDTEQNMRRVLGYNAAAWLNMATQPNRTALSQTQTISTAPQLLPLFDWSELANADTHPVLGVIGPMGGGKSRLIRWLAKGTLNTPTVKVMDIYGRQSEWAGCEVIGEHPEMLALMGADVEAIAQDVKDFRSGKQESDFTGILTVLEEAPDTLKSLRGESKDDEKLVDLWIGKMTTVTRKIRRRLCIVSVKMSGADFGTGAESRDTATLIFPGDQGVSLAMKDANMLKLGRKDMGELRQQLKDSLQGIKRPALVYHQGEWFPASIPELDGAGNQIGGMGSSSMLTGGADRGALPTAQDPRAQLNALYYREEFDLGPVQGEDADRADDGPELYGPDGSLAKIPAAILEYAQGKPDGVTARMLTQNKRALRDVSTPLIEAYFDLLKSVGLGVVGTVGGALTFIAKQG
jgi:hypothetical protein